MPISTPSGGAKEQKYDSPNVFYEKIKPMWPWAGYTVPKYTQKNGTINQNYTKVAFIPLMQLILIYFPLFLLYEF